MKVSFLDLREKEVINVYSGSRLGRIVDVVFDVASGEVLGIVVPGDKKLFKKSEDVFVPLDKLKRIGSDVILVGLQNEGVYSNTRQRSEQSRRRGNIDTYYENGYITQTPSGVQPQNPIRQNEPDVYYKKVGEDASGSKTYAANIGFGQTTAKYTTESQSQSNTSFVRLKPLESKKYK